MHVLVSSPPNKGSELSVKLHLGTGTVQQTVSSQNPYVEPPNDTIQR